MHVYPSMHKTILGTCQMSCDICAQVHAIGLCTDVSIAVHTMGVMIDSTTGKVISRQYRDWSEGPQYIQYLTPRLNKMTIFYGIITCSLCSRQNELLTSILFLSFL